ILQNLEIVIVPPNQRPFTIRTDCALRKIPSRHTSNKPATAALQSPRNTLADRFLGNFEPDREIEWGMMASENRRQAFGLRTRAREAIKDKTMRTVQAQPVFDQFHNCCIRDKTTPLNRLGSRGSQGCPKVVLPARVRVCGRDPL